jgi:hypothetical protein
VEVEEHSKEHKMPVYDFRCPECERIKKDVFKHHWKDEELCTMHGRDYRVVMEKIPSLMIPHVFPADGIFLEHVSSTGKRFFSKKEMKDYARKNDLEIGYIE